MKRYKLPVMSIVFMLIVCVLYSAYVKVITPKYYTDQIYSTTVTYQGFYDLKKDTVDVLFLGSSHGACGFLPQVLYDEYKITSYNLSCEQQSLFTSYYWLCEALKTQEPRVVVLESYMLYENYDNGPLVSESDITRKAFDNMKWSKNKIQAINEICQLDNTQNKLSFYFPNIRYHDRWKELKKKDIEFKKAHYSELKGYTMIPKKGGGDYTGYQLSECENNTEMNPLMQEYLEKIKELCKEKNIELVLVYTPAKNYGKSVVANLEDYAKSQDIRLIDFNDAEVFSAAGYNFGKMNSDKGHANIWGATCITKYIGSILSSEASITPHQDDQWESTAEFYQFALSQCEMIYKNKPEDIEDYIYCISDDRYEVNITSDIEQKKKYEVYEKRTGRLIDIAIIDESSEERSIHHEKVDIN